MTDDSSYCVDVSLYLAVLKMKEIHILDMET